MSSFSSVRILPLIIPHIPSIKFQYCQCNFLQFTLFVILLTNVLTRNDILSRRHHSAVLLRVHQTVQGERLLLLSLVSLGQ